MVVEVRLAQALETLGQQDPAQALIGDFKVFIDDDIVITTILSEAWSVLCVPETVQVHGVLSTT